MSYCSHDIHCPGHGPGHDAQTPGIDLPVVPTVEFDPPIVPTPPMEELLDARVILRKQVKSGHPARKAKALRDLLVLERIIADAKRAAGKSEADYV